jgi:putative transposase
VVGIIEPDGENLHRRVRQTRLDHAHKTALRLVRDNQAVYAEDLAVSGLMRTRLAM